MLLASRESKPWPCLQDASNLNQKCKSKDRGILLLFPNGEAEPPDWEMLPAMVQDLVLRASSRILVPCLCAPSSYHSRPEF